MNTSSCGSAGYRTPDNSRSPAQARPNWPGFADRFHARGRLPDIGRPVCRWHRWPVAVSAQIYPAQELIVPVQQQEEFSHAMCFETSIETGIMAGRRRRRNTQLHIPRPMPAGYRTGPRTHGLVPLVLLFAKKAPAFANAISSPSVWASKTNVMLVYCYNGLSTGASTDRSHVYAAIRPQPDCRYSSLNQFLFNG